MDGGAFCAGERRGLDDLERRGIANGKWHIRAQHHPLTADHIHEIAQGPRVLNDHASARVVGLTYSNGAGFMMAASIRPIAHRCPRSNFDSPPPAGRRLAVTRPWMTANHAAPAMKANPFPAGGPCQASCAPPLSARRPIRI